MYIDKRERRTNMLLLFTIIWYFIDIKHYGKKFVNENCNFYERIGRWFVTFGWTEILLLCYYIYLH